MGITQKDIAERLNVSQSQVARALSGRSAGRSTVSEETRLRIEAVAREMGYVLSGNHEARTMAAKRHGQAIKSGVIAVPLPPIEAPFLGHLPFFMPILSGMGSAAQNLDLELCMCVVRRNEVPRIIREGTVDGIVAMAGLDFEMPATRAMQEMNIPVVTFHSAYDGVASVSPDDRDGSHQITRHLLELGHRRIAFLGTDNRQRVCDERLLGYRDAMAEYNAVVQEEWIETSLMLRFTQAGAYCPGCEGCASCVGLDVLIERSGGLVDGRPTFTAVVCYNDPIAMGVVTRARTFGFDVPGDLSVTGFDNTSGDYHFQPQITSLNFPRYEMGRQTIQLLNEMICARSMADIDAAIRHEVFPVEMALHGSTAPPAYSEEKFMVSSPGKSAVAQLVPN